LKPEFFSRKSELITEYTTKMNPDEFRLFLIDFYSDDPAVTDVMISSLDDGTVCYIPVTENFFVVDQDRLTNILYENGLNETQEEIAAASTVREAGDIYLSWVLSLEDKIDHDLFAYTLKQAKAAINDNSQKEPL